MARYPRPPVVEAALIIGYTPLPPPALDELKALAESLKAAYPVIQPRMQGIMQINFGQSMGATAAQGQDGFVLRSQDGRHVVQLALDSLAVSFLRPYTDWGDLTAESKRIWDALCAKVGSVAPFAPTSVTVRFINHIPIEPQERTNDLVSVYIEVPERLARPAQFYMRLSFEYKAFMVTIQEGFVPLFSDPTKPAMLLDLALQKAVDAKTLWAEVTSAREVKNDLFESIITDKSRKSFE